jgi:hypothetical protein
MQDIGMLSEIERLGREDFVVYCFTSTTDPFEQRLACEILYSSCQQFLALEPIVQNVDLRRAWLQVGIELCEQGRQCLVWSDRDGLNACVGQYARVLTKLCGETFVKEMADSEERKRIQRVWQFQNVTF